MAAWESFENAEDQTWTVDAGTPAYGSPGSHGSSNYYRTINSGAGNAQYAIFPGTGGTVYVGIWIDTATDALTDGAWIKIAQIQTTPDGYNCVSLRVRKSGTQLVLDLWDDYNDALLDSVNIDAATWYAVNVYYSSSSDAWEWWVSETTDIGSPQGSGSVDWSRQPGRLRIGYLTNAGTWGAGTTTFRWDSINVSRTSNEHDAEDGGGEPAVASIYRGRGILSGVGRGIFG
jgi:hypothetical protein